jgi:transposase
LLGVERTVVENVLFEDDNGGGGLLVAHVRPRKGARRRCGRCGRRCPWYDGGEGRRRWRGLDAGVLRVVLEADAPRVSCREHGVTVAQVPWARHGAGHTYALDDQVAWLAVHTSKTAVAELMRIAWRTVGAICARVARDGQGGVDRLAGLRRIGIDEISYKKGHRYITCVVDHDTARLVWAAAGRDSDTVAAFFDALGAERAAQLTHVSTDGADWIIKVVDARCPSAIRAADPYHVVAWATEALDQVRRDVWNTTRGGKGRATEASKALKNARWALWKDPDDLTKAQQNKLDWIQRTHPRLHRAWALKEGLRWVFHLSRQGFPRLATTALERWISWARRCRIPSFVDLARRVVRHRDAIEASIEHRLSNALVESVNTKLRLITRTAFGFHDPHALIGLAMLAWAGCAHHFPAGPGSTRPEHRCEGSALALPTLPQRAGDLRPATPKGVPRTSPASKGQASLRSVAMRPLATGREPRTGHRLPDREDHQSRPVLDHATAPTDTAGGPEIVATTALPNYSDAVDLTH